MGDAVFCAENEEAVEVRVGPLHRELKGIVWVGDRAVSTNPDSAPDRCADFTQQDVQLVILGSTGLVHGDTLAQLSQLEGLASPEGA